jgi:hypothetical protein
MEENRLTFSRVHPNQASSIASTGWKSSNTSSLSVKGQLFSLTFSFCRTGVGVEKVRRQNVFSPASIPPVFLLSVPLSGGRQNRCCGLAEEAHESLDVLGHRCQEELLPHELQSPQAQAVQPDLILQFREQGFHLLSLPLCLGELCRAD